MSTSLMRLERKLARLSTQVHIRMTATEDNRLHRNGINASRKDKIWKKYEIKPFALLSNRQNNVTKPVNEVVRSLDHVVISEEQFS